MDIASPPERQDVEPERESLALYGAVVHDTPTDVIYRREEPMRCRVGAG